VKTNGKKLRASVLAGVLAAAMVLTGTFAWRSISQRTTNKIMDSRNPGGRIHDDFKGLEDKNVYAENFTDEADGAPVFARIKLLEYMEMGEDAGVNLAAKDRKANPLLWGDRTYVSVNDTSTWKTFDPTDENDPFRKYWDLTFGGSTAYLPTFNKNKDSLSVDVNGTYEGRDGIFNEDDPYSDYEPHASGQKVTKDAYYDADPEDQDEYRAGVSIAPGAGGTEGVNYIKKSEEHEVKSTLNSLGIITMTAWKTAGMPICDRWIYDDSEDGGGWFYWPKPIMPQTATGLLLDKVGQRMTAGEKSYYAIEVVGEFATASQWGDKSAPEKDPAQGFYLGGFSDNAKALLDQATKVETGKDGKCYLTRSNGVYQEVLNETGTLSELVCAGEDKLIGTADDRQDGVVHVEGGLTVEGVTYSEYFLEPTATENYYRATSPTSNLGTAEDVRLWVVSGSFPTGRLTARPVTSVTVQAQDRASQVKLGTTLQYTATVVTSMANKEVAWQLENNRDPGTTISETGLLTLGSSEAAGTELTIIATSKLDNRVSSKTTVTVVTDITIVLDGVEYYVLKTDSANNRALVLSACVLEKLPMNTNDAYIHYPQSDLSKYLNETLSGGWLYNKPEIQNCAILTTIKTRTNRNTTDWEDCLCKVFLLSEADTFGSFNNKTDAVLTDDYTAGGKLTAPGGSWAADEISGGPSSWWLRSPFVYGGNAAVVMSSGGDMATGCARTDANVGIRPAAWVMLNGVQVASEKNSAGVAPGGKLQFSATVVENMKPAANQAVTWKVTGNTSGTSIDASGLLTVAVGETARSLTVQAVSAADGTLVGSKEVLVGDVMTLDGLPFYVLKRESNQALILSAYVLERRPMDADDGYTHYPQSDLCEYLNKTLLGGWLYNKPEIQKRAISTTIKTRTNRNTTEWEDCSCKVFLLSEADVFGSFNNNADAAQADDYTAGGKLTAPGGSWAADDISGGPSLWWLRSPFAYGNNAAVVESSGSGTITGCGRMDANVGVRPALWVTIS